MIKIVGTSFRPLPKEKQYKISQELDVNGVPAANLTGILLPEPTNPYDPTAVAVYLPTTDGGSHHCGYLAKDEPAKAGIKGATCCLVQIVAYNTVGMSNAYRILQINGQTV